MLRIFERSLFVLRGYRQRKYSYAWNFSFSFGEGYDCLGPSRDKTSYNIWGDQKKCSKQCPENGEFALRKVGNNLPENTAS